MLISIKYKKNLNNYFFNKFIQNKEKIFVFKIRFTLLQHFIFMDLIVSKKYLFKFDENN